MADETIPSLAELRARKTGRRASPVAAGSQMGLGFGSAPAEAAVAEDLPRPTDREAGRRDEAPAWAARRCERPAVVREARTAEPDADEAQAPREPTVASERRVWSVRELVGELRMRVERAFAVVWVEGEISNCRMAGSGHVYLTLKDGEAQLQVALFRRQAQGLRFRPENGMAVLVRGRLSVYEGRGELQLIAETMEPRGAGALLVAFEQLKARLKAEGLFDAARKRALPAFPKTVGVVTSMDGAALHDVITVVRRRNARLNLLVFPALVQGNGCARSVIAGLRWFAARPGVVDMVLLARGGGSAEDLCGFNDEAMARAIAASPVPVISAIGHETDFSIADFVADLRAPTPSAAAEIMTEAQHRVEERLHRLERGLQRAVQMRVLQAERRLERVSAERLQDRMHRSLDRKQQRLDELERRLLRARDAGVERRGARLDRLQKRLERLNPGWRLGWDRNRLQAARHRLLTAGPVGVQRRRERVERLAARLEALSPVAVLERGYALVYELAYDLPGTDAGEGGLVGSGRLLRSAEETAAGRRVMARLGRGSLMAEVRETRSE